MVRFAKSVKRRRLNVDLITRTQCSGKALGAACPDATMATNARNRHVEPCYKQHTAVDDCASCALVGYIPAQPSAIDESVRSGVALIRGFGHP
jgi:hypothetical protein